MARRQPFYTAGSGMSLQLLAGVSARISVCLKGETRNPRDQRWLRLGWEPFRSAQVVLSALRDVEKWNRDFAGVRIQKVRSILS
jgi:hypothetical protein